MTTWTDRDGATFVTYFVREHDERFDAIATARLLAERDRLAVTDVVSAVQQSSDGAWRVELRVKGEQDEHTPTAYP